MVEHVAAHLGLDGTEVRQRNFWRPEGVGLPQVLPAVEPSPTLKPSVQEIAENPQVGPRLGLCVIPGDGSTITGGAKAWTVCHFRRMLKDC